MSKNELIQYTDDLIQDALSLKKKAMRYSFILQGLAIFFSLILFILIWYQISSGISIGVAGISDIAGTTIIVLIWLSAKAIWKDSIAHSARAGQLEDLKIIVMLSDDKLTIQPIEAGKLIMSLRRDGVAKDMHLEAFSPKIPSIGKNK